MENKLLPCPHCGGRAVMVEGKRPENIGRYSVTCGQCFCATRWEISPENAAYDWNRRAAPANPPLTLEQLREMDGLPVYVQFGDGEQGYAVVEIDRGDVTLWGPDFPQENPDMDFYNMEYNDPAGSYGLHVLGWRAYAHKPAEEDA